VAHGGDDDRVSTAACEPSDAPVDVATQHDRADALGERRQPGRTAPEAVAPGSGAKRHPPANEAKNHGPSTIFMPTLVGGLNETYSLTIRSRER
jgi:hypothetical protein